MTTDAEWNAEYEARYGPDDDGTVDAPPVTLADFLLARVTEDEEEAHAEFALRISADSVFFVQYAPNPDLPPPNLTRIAVSDKSPQATYTFNLHPWPARVLAECQAKRQIVATHEQAWDNCDWECAACGWSPAIDGGCLTLRLLALPYADHPDYQQEWRP